MTREERLEAYRTTTYRVWPAGRAEVPLEILIGRGHPKLDELLAQLSAPTHFSGRDASGHWALLTAYNPGEDQPPEELNRDRMAALVRGLDQYGLQHLDADGEGVDGFTEPMLFLPHCPRQFAERVGRVYRQWAIVVGERGGEATLLILTDGAAE